MKKISLIILSTFILPVMLLAQSNGTVSLAGGQKYVVENKLSTNSSSEMQGQSMETTADVTSVYNIEVNDSKDNNYNMTNKLAALKLTMSSMGQNVNFDSDKKEDMDGEMGSALKGIINQPNAVVMDKSGNIISSNSTDTTNKQSSSQTDMIMKQLGDPQLLGYGAKMAFMVIPKGASVGTTWQDSTSSEGITRVTKYTIKDINKDTANVTFTGTESRDTKMEMQGMEINTKTTGTFAGDQKINIKTGVIFLNNTAADAKGTISVMGQDIPTNIKSSSVTTVTAL